jgi:hypothetical protein
MVTVDQALICFEAVLRTKDANNGTLDANNGTVDGDNGTLDGGAGRDPNYEGTAGGV